MLDKFYAFIDDQVEAVTPEEALARNTYIVANVSLSKAMQRLSAWKDEEGPELEFHRQNRIHVSKELKRRGQAPQIIIDLREQQQQLDEAIADMVQKRKYMEADLAVKRKNAANAKSELKNIRKANSR